MRGVLTLLRPGPARRHVKVALHRAFRKQTIRHFAENSALGLRFSSRFVAGTQLEDVIRATQVVNEWGASVSIDNLGENVTNADESKHSAELYHRCSTRFQPAS